MHFHISALTFIILPEEIPNQGAEVTESEKELSDLECAAKRKRTMILDLDSEDEPFSHNTKKRRQTCIISSDDDSESAHNKVSNVDCSCSISS